MALNLKFSTGFANALLDGDIDGAFNSGFLDIYSGTQPANANSTEGSVNLLARVELPADAFDDAAAGGAIQKKGTWEEAAAILNGTATWFRLRESGDSGGASTTAKRIDGTVGTVAGQFDLVLTSTQIVAGDPVVIDTGSLYVSVT